MIIKFFIIGEMMLVVCIKIGEVEMMFLKIIYCNYCFRVFLKVFLKF